MARCTRRLAGARVCHVYLFAELLRFARVTHLSGPCPPHPSAMSAECGFPADHSLVACDCIWPEPPPP